MTIKPEDYVRFDRQRVSLKVGTSWVEVCGPIQTYPTKHVHDAVIKCIETVLKDLEKGEVANETPPEVIVPKPGV